MRSVLTELSSCCVILDAVLGACGSFPFEVFGKMYRFQITGQKKKKKKKKKKQNTLRKLLRGESVISVNLYYITFLWSNF